MITASDTGTQTIRLPDGRVVGHVAGGRFVKSVSRRKHFYARYGGWAADVASLDEAERAGASVVEIHDQDTGVTYEAELATMRAQGYRIEHGRHGAQVVLPLRFWRVPKLQPSLF